MKTYCLGGAMIGGIRLAFGREWGLYILFKGITAYVACDALIRI